MDSTLAANGEDSVIEPHVRWAEGREPAPEPRMPPGYVGRHWASKPEQFRDDAGYVPRHAACEDES